MDLISILKWYLDAGVDECVAEVATNRLAQRPQKPISDKRADSQNLSDTVQNSAKQADTFVQQAITASAKANSLSELDAALAEFTGCGLSKTAAHLLSGIGVPNPRVLCIIESPRAGDDRAGALFNDDSSQLLLKMIQSIGLDYTQDTYIAPLSPWRTPGDRSLSDMELQHCLPFLKRRIELLEPEILILFGSVVSGALLGISSISKAREKAAEYTSPQTNHPIKAFTTFAPTFLIKTPSQKRRAWDDLQKIQQYLIGL